MSDIREQHSALNARDDMLAIADAWPALLSRLAQSGNGDRSGVRTKPSSRPPIDVHVSDVIAEITAWVHFLARVLMDEVRVEVAVPGPVKGSWSDPWRPVVTDVRPLLREIARERIGHFTHHPDEGMRTAFMDDAHEHRRSAETTAYPTGRRRIDLRIACFDAGTGTDGSRIPCPGEYTIMLDPGAYLMPDMVCSADKLHRITPSEWQRASRKAAMDPAAMGALLERIKGGVA